MLDALRRRMSGISRILREPDAASSTNPSRDSHCPAEPGIRPGPRLVDRSPSHVFCLDQPTSVPVYDRFVVQAWIASAKPISSVRLANGGVLEEVARPDVVAVHGNRFEHVRGLRGWLPSSDRKSVV